jgi:hypothetical protein
MNRLMQADIQAYPFERLLLLKNSSQMQSP